MIVCLKSSAWECELIERADTCAVLLSRLSAAIRGALIRSLADCKRNRPAQPSNLDLVGEFFARLAIQVGLPELKRLPVRDMSKILLDFLSACFVRTNCIQQAKQFHDVFGLLTLFQSVSDG